MSCLSLWDSPRVHSCPARHRVLHQLYRLRLCRCPCRVLDGTYSLTWQLMSYEMSLTLRARAGCQVRSC